MRGGIYTPLHTKEEWGGPSFNTPLLRVRSSEKHSVEGLTLCLVPFSGPGTVTLYIDDLARAGVVVGWRSGCGGGVSEGGHEALERERVRGGESR